jgi:hypothetical protein
MKIRIFLFSLILLPFYLTAQQIRINEIMALNTSTISDNQGMYSDWIELRNTSGTAYDLAGHYITDNASNLTKFRFTLSTGQLVIPANGYLLIWASSNPSAGVNHVDFSLSSSNGETVILVLPNGSTIMDQFNFPPQRADVSIGRSETNAVKYYSPASPGVLNNASNSYEGFLAAPNFSRQGGFFNSNFSLSISHTEPGVSIYYTSDGSDPNPSNLGGTSYQYKNSFPETPSNPAGPLLSRSYITQNYSAPITIFNRTSTSNQISTISSTIDYNPTYIPTYNVEKANIIRAIAVKPGLLPSEIVTQTYLYSPNAQNPYSFPVVSLTTQENNLFSYTNGIYTAGKTFDDFRIANPSGDLTWCPTGNFSLRGSSTEKSANFEFFENNISVVNQPIGLRINGGCSSKNRYKSLRLYGSERFNEHSFFDEAPNLFHHRLLLRNSGNDQLMTFFKDEFAREWLKHLKFGSQKSKPSILFLNGEYWGIHNIRERIDKYYLHELYGVNPDNIDLRKVNYFEPDEMSEGDDIHYNYTYNYIMTNNVSNSAHFNHIETLIDLESFIDYHVAQIFIGNIDWPQNNVRLWRTKNAYNPSGNYADGRWRYIFFDADRSLGEIVQANNNDLLDVFLKPDSELLGKLMTSTEFKNRFITRFADLLNTSFRPQFGLPIFHTFKNLYLPEIPKHLQRWKTHANMAAWHAQCDTVQNYVTQRGQLMYDHINYAMGTNGTFNLTVLSQNLTYGHVKVNSVVADPNLTRGLSMSGRTWTGRYFRNIPFKIKAVPKPGYRFTHWIHNGSTVYANEILISSSTNLTYEAFFEYTGLSENPYPLAKNIKDCGYKLNSWNAAAPANTFPPNGAFVYMTKEENPRASALEPTLSYTSGAYNLSSGTRINGLNGGGFSFINTGGDNPGYPASRLGGFVLAINTTNVHRLHIKWSAKTITANNRKYKVRLVYRVGDLGNFIPLGPEYSSGSTGHSQTFDDIFLPEAALNKGYVQLLWQYYDTRTVTSGPRDEIAISEISIGEKILRPSNLTPVSSPNYPVKIRSTEVMSSSQTRKEVATRSITLEPGFMAETGTTFKAEIKNCN